MKDKLPPIHVLALFFMGLLFLVNGILASLNDVLKPFFQRLFDLNYTQSSYIHFVYYISNVFISIPASMLASRLGYRKSILIGLVFMFLGISTGIFASYMNSYYVYVGAVFFMAIGVSAAGVLVNPYVSQLTSNHPGRLNLVNSFYPAGGMLGPLVGGFLLYKGQQAAAVEVASSDTRILYITLMALTLVPISLFAAIKIPEIKISRTTINLQTLGSLNRDFPALKWGMICMFLYVGIEVATGSLIVKFLALPNILGMDDSDAGNWVSIYWGSFFVGRLLGAFAGNYFSSRDMLRATTIGSLVICGMVILGSGMPAAVAVVSLGFANSVMFSSIFAMTVEGMGKRVQEASAFFFMMTIGGSFVTYFQNNLADMPQFGIQGSFGLTFLCYLYILWYAFIGYNHNRTLKPTT
ncbi:MAG: MFS transporter [Bacteroidota bacterium]